MTDEGLIFNSLKNSNCDGYLLFSYLVKGGVSRGYANVSLTPTLWMIPVYLPIVVRFRSRINSHKRDILISGW